MGKEGVSREQVSEFCSSHAEWRLKENKFVRKFRFKHFKLAMLFVNKVAWLAESMSHHPDIKINYNVVTLSVTTHDSGGITERDFKLIAEIDKL